jgi:hypothetical protein
MPEENLEDLKMRLAALEDKLRKICITEEELRALDITEKELKAFQKVAAALAERTSGLDVGRGRRVPLFWYMCGVPLQMSCAYIAGYPVTYSAIGFGSLGS